MKILHIIDSSGLYGAEMVLLSLMDWQQRLGYHPMLLSVGDIDVGEKHIEKEAKHRGLDLISVRFRVVFGSARLIKIAKQLEPDIIHSHGYKCDILLGIVPKVFRKVPTITTLHGWTVTSWHTKMKLYQVLNAITLKNFDKVVAVSSMIQTHVLLRIIGVRSVIIRNGISELDFSEKLIPPKEYQIVKKRTNAFRVVSIGRLSPEKGYEILIKATHLLHHRGMDLEVYIFGEGSQRPYLERMIENAGLKDRFYLPGYCKNAFRLIPHFNLFVLPSFTEGLPITLLEAMQAAVPIIATDVGEIPLVLREGQLGAIIPSKNPEALANAIENVYENIQTVTKKVSRARNVVLKEFNLEKMTGEYIRHYETLIWQK